MIEDYTGEKTTPKRKAQDELYDAISVRMEFFMEHLEDEAMTEREKQQVYTQATKLADRINKLLGFEPEYNQL